MTEKCQVVDFYRIKMWCEMPQLLENQRRPLSNVRCAYIRSLNAMRGTWEPKWENVWPQPSITEKADDLGHNSQRGACGSKRSTTVRQSQVFEKLNEAYQSSPWTNSIEIKWGGESSGRQIVGPLGRCGSSKAFWEYQWFPARGAWNQ